MNAGLAAVAWRLSAALQSEGTRSMPRIAGVPHSLAFPRLPSSARVLLLVDFTGSAAQSGAAGDG